MDRRITYTGALPVTLDVLEPQRQAIIGLSNVLQAALGTGTLIDGFTCVPTSPASLAVQIPAGGCIISQQVLDSSAYGDMVADTSTQVMKLGTHPALTELTLTPPGTSGYAQNYLIQIAFQESDADAQVLPYYNAANPSAPLNGPGGTGTAQNTHRIDRAVVSYKAGTPAPAGTQTTPSPDSGNVGAFVVTVANGQTQITSGDIAAYASAPTIPYKVPQVAASVQTGAWSYAADTGSANALVAALSPVPASLVIGMAVRIKAVAANTGAATLNLNSLGVKSIVRPGGAALRAGEIAAGAELSLVYDGTNWQLMSSSVQFATSGETVAGTAIGLATDPAGVRAAILQGTPVGTLGMWPTETLPTGWLERNGAAISRTTYAALFAVIGTMYGAGDGSTTFNLPDDRGYFARYWDHGAARDPDRTSRTNRGDGTTGDHVGTRQTGQYTQHSHTVSDPGHAHNSYQNGTGHGSANGADWSGAIASSYLATSGATTGISIQNSGGSETRPMNVYHMPIIRAY